MADQFPAPTKMVLSPAAQAVLDALLNTPVNSRQLCDGRAPHIKLAAALRAAADQVVPEGGVFLSSASAARTRRELLAIADELDQP